MSDHGIDMSRKPVKIADVMATGKGRVTRLATGADLIGGGRFRGKQVVLWFGPGAEKRIHAATMAAEKRVRSGGTGVIVVALGPYVVNTAVIIEQLSGNVLLMDLPSAAAAANMARRLELLAARSLLKR